MCNTGIEHDAALVNLANVNTGKDNFAILAFVNSDVEHFVNHANVKICFSFLSLFIFIIDTNNCLEKKNSASTLLVVVDCLLLKQKLL